MHNHITLTIMAGGQSSRMGRDKAFIPINGQPMIERIIARTQHLGQIATHIITNSPDKYAYLGLPMFADVFPNKGSLGGIYTALHHSPTPYTWVIACDMPFVSAKLLHHMQSFADDTHDVIVPRVNERPQGLHAIYHQRCMNMIRQRLKQDKLRVIGFYDSVSVCYLDEDDYKAIASAQQAFMNVNTPKECNDAQNIAQSEETSD